MRISRSRVLMTVNGLGHLAWMGLLARLLFFEEGGGMSVQHQAPEGNPYLTVGICMVIAGLIALWMRVTLLSEEPVGKE
jgi:hypothetical protein